MIKLIKNIIIFASILTSIIVALFYCFYKIGGNDLPAPAFSNSISFNEKIDFIKGKNLSEIEYASVGSSMSLNNISSECVVEALGENYINLASWGFKISDTENYLKNMTGFFPNLKTVIISTSFMDFSSSARNIEVDYAIIRNSLKYDLNILNYLLSFNLKYMYENSKINKWNKKKKNSYQNLSYDKYGGAILDIDSAHIDNLRWNKNILEFKVSDEELQSLNRIIELLSSKDIRTIVAIPPQRHGLAGEVNMLSIEAEIRKIRSIVENNNGIFFNSFEIGEWSDSLFVDYCHLNKLGAKKYTELILKKYLSN
jgi:hypothetical protein